MRRAERRARAFLPRRTLVLGAGRHMVLRNSRPLGTRPFFDLKLLPKSPFGAGHVPRGGGGGCSGVSPGPVGLDPPGPGPGPRPGGGGGGPPQPIPRVVKVGAL